jgi:hypothetical protein
MQKFRLPSVFSLVDIVYLTELLYVREIALAIDKSAKSRINILEQIDRSEQIFRISIYTAHTFDISIHHY